METRSAAGREQGVPGPGASSSGRDQLQESESGSRRRRKLPWRGGGGRIFGVLEHGGSRAGSGGRLPAGGFRPGVGGFRGGTCQKGGGRHVEGWVFFSRLSPSSLIPPWGRAANRRRFPGPASTFPSTSPAMGSRPTGIATSSTTGWNRFRRGDAKGDGSVNITDPQVILDWLFRGGPVPDCWDGADTDDDSHIDLTDSVFLLNFLFQGGPPPPLPGPDECGRDPTADFLGCLRNTECPIP